MLEFQLGISKQIVNAVENETAKIIFNLKNTSDKAIHCLSYKFQSFWQGKTVENFNPHEFFFTVNPNEEKIKEFGEVDIAKAYLAGNIAAGDYEIVVQIRYFECGSEKVESITSLVEVKLVGEAKIEE